MILKNLMKVSLILFHLLMVLYGSSSLLLSQFNLSLVPLGSIENFLHFYGLVTGSGTNYGFFSPGIGGQLKAQFEITDSNNHKYFTPLQPQTTHEVDLRISNIIDQFAYNSNLPIEKNFKRSLAASLAGTIFGEHSNAKQVRVMLEEYNPVSIQEYVEGERAQWNPIYQATFKVQLRTK